MRRHFHIPHGREDEHAAALTVGLACLPAGFIGEVCSVCRGRGRYDQSYTAGCGGGRFRLSGPCLWCDEAGLTQHGRPAPISVLHQVLGAAACDGVAT